jgi:MoxR-like ATPase
VVVLIDEIDKAESDLPNGLLEALGAGVFTPQGRSEPVTVQGEEAPLIIITSNEERALPDAFVRRCLVLCIELKKPGDELVHWLIERGKAHFKNVDDSVLEQAARLLSKDRKEAIEQQRSPKPGQAEYLDLVRAVRALRPDDAEAQKDLLTEVGKYTLNKHQGTG